MKKSKTSMADKEQKEMISFFVSKELKERFREEAQLRERSMSQMLAFLMRNFVEKAEEKRNQKNPNDEKES